jgi:hypothetical protein
MEVSYTIVRLLQISSLIALPKGEKVEPVGMERRRLTLVLSSANGCRVGIERTSVSTRVVLKLERYT